MDKISYALGMNIAQNLAHSGLEEVNIEDFTKGLSAIINKETPAMSVQEANELLQQFFTELEKKKYQANIDKGNNFLSENSKKEGVTTLASGLQYEVLTKGNGATPKATDTVRCHYHGTLINGEVFDSSVQRGQPADFPVNGVIQGWVEALQLMQEGDKWRLYVPSNLAYGERGAGGAIGPHTTLIFDVELISIL